jgi:hypothetical protein
LSCVRNSIFRPFLFRSIRNERCVFQMWSLWFYTDHWLWCSFIADTNLYAEK